LTNHSCIGFTGLSQSLDWWNFHHNGKLKRIPISPLLVTNQVDTALDACLRGMGCGMFLDYQIRDALTDGRLIQLLTEFELPKQPISLLYPSTRLLSSRVRAYLDWSVPRLRERLAFPAISAST
jgi:DNA-binding transcriptional LysR family regulator